VAVEVVSAQLSLSQHQLPLRPTKIMSISREKLCRPQNWCCPRSFVALHSWINPLSGQLRFVHFPPTAMLIFIAMLIGLRFIYPFGLESLSDCQFIMMRPRWFRGSGWNLDYSPLRPALFLSRISFTGTTANGW